MPEIGLDGPGVDAPGVGFLAARKDARDFLEILAPGERLRHEFLAAPDILERLRRHCRVTHRVSDRGVAQVVLKPPGIGAPQLAQRESDLFIACSEAVSP